MAACICRSVDSWASLRSVSGHLKRGTISGEATSRVLRIGPSAGNGTLFGEACVVGSLKMLLGPEFASPRTQTADHRRESRLTPQLGPWAERAQHALEGRHLRRTAGDRHNIHIGRLQPRRVERPPADRRQLLELRTDRRFELGPAYVRAQLYAWHLRRQLGRITPGEL